MLHMDHDFELANGLQDADIEMGELVAAGNLEAKLRKMGLCAHSWHGPVEFGKPARVCHNCNKQFKNEEELEDERREQII